VLDLTRFRVLTFDCYGTLINWEAGIFGALRPILAAHGKSIDDVSVLELYADLELQAEKGEYIPYREVLQQVVRGFGKRLGFNPNEAEVRSLPESLGEWKPFPDTVQGLQRLAKRFRLAIVSNIDDDLFALTRPKLGVAFDQVITAQQARCYKPCRRIFQLAQERIEVRPEEWLHVGQSVHHDVIPAKALGLSSVWVNRRSPRAGAGATKAATGQPDLEVPDIATLAAL